VTSTVNALLNTSNALRKLVTWSANPFDLTPREVSPRGVMTRPRSVPALTGGTSITDFSDWDE
jgi:hypothetical protein